ncbi:MAG: hypothetical protein WBE92_05795 [Steroidobacteraceae bacterium]
MTTPELMQAGYEFVRARRRNWFTGFAGKRRAAAQVRPPGNVLEGIEGRAALAA